jgi:SAM-dependent methyltransferase
MPSSDDPLQYPRIGRLKMNAPSRCGLCNGDTVEAFRARDYRRPIDKTEYSVRWCDECSFGQIHGISAADVEKFFDIPYYTHGPNQTDKSEHLANLKVGQESFCDRLIIHLAWRVDPSAHLAPSELGTASGRTLCDLGCGDGQNLARFSGAGFKVVGVEPDPVARANAAHFARVLDGTIESLPKEISSSRFDVVLLSHVLDCCVDVKSAILNIRSIVSPGGTVIIEVPNCAARGFRIYGAEWPWTDVPRHLSFFTEKSLRTILAEAGLSVRVVRYLGYTRQFRLFWKATQAAIQEEIGNKNSRRRIPSWLWLAETAFASDASKYDSIRVHATLI